MPCHGSSCRQGRAPCRTPMRCTETEPEYEAAVAFIRRRRPNMPAPTAPLHCAQEEREAETDAGPMSAEAFLGWIDNFNPARLAHAVGAFFTRSR